MPEQTTNPRELLQRLDSTLQTLSQDPSFGGAQAVVNAVVAFLGITVEQDGWKLFSDSAGKIRANGHWFMPADGYADRRAAYEVAKGNVRNIDFKTYWVQNTNKSVIHWATAITPNFEDAPWLASENVGIDFVIPAKADRVFVVLSKEHALRVIELCDRVSPTAAEIFSKWTQTFDFSHKAQFHQILWDSFNFEAINKLFYKTISSFFTELKQHLRSTAAELFDDHSAALFVNRLIGRIIFCWFVDKKGILNPEENYFVANGATASEHYHAKLETLFFRILNTPVDERVEGLDAKTPFLNGGLFEAKAGDYDGDARVSFPADYFDRLYEFLRRYNFTTDESSSAFQQVAIDPEMLGRIFENLLAEQVEETGEQARKAKGAFYTPREIVDYMCKESLREYLRSRIPETSDRDEQFAKLLDKKPHEFRDQQRNYRGDLKPYKHDLIEALDELTVLDPACGSGAFPMGMLQLLLETYDRLESDYDPYKKKLTIIKNNIFGVDIEPMAVEIARLRAWLSIIVDEDVSDGRIEPLPNLDFKFVCANTLIPLDHSEGLYDTLKEDQLIEVRDEYFRARKYSRKQELREKFGVLLKGKGMDGMFSSEREKQLKTYQPFNAEKSAAFFDSRVMFGIENGFNIVIGNPPYVRHEKIKHLKPLFERFAVYTGTADLLVYFYERGYEVLAEKGILTFITSNKFMRAKYGENLRRFLRKELYIKEIIDFGELPVFASAATFPAIYITQKTDKKTETSFTQIKSMEQLSDLASAIAKGKSSMSESAFEDKGWALSNTGEISILDKMKSVGMLLSDYVHDGVKYGIKTGCNEAFIIDRTVRDQLIEQVTEAEDFIKPFVNGDDIRKYKVDFKEKYLIAIPSGWTDNHRGDIEPETFFRTRYPSIYKHLKDIGDRAKASKGKGLYERDDQGKYWWELRACAYYDAFLHSKIIFPEIAMSSRFAFDETGVFGNKTTFIIPGNDLYLLGVLNSKAVWFFLTKICATMGNPSQGGRLNLQKIYLETVPVATPSEKDRSIIQDLVRSIIGMNDPAQAAAIQTQIDKKIYQLYGFSDEEVQIIEG